ncbi:MAG: anti-sigma factor antagonist [Clostridiales bacterium]|nr:anti-sigma factor antagonist [Candidatus Cacconaster stercorequi]
MSMVKARQDGDTLYLCPYGRIDSANAAQAEAEMGALRAESSCGNVILDLEELAYISSAGLRVVLRLRKEIPTLKIINASAEVYDIFDMTGFTEMMEIEKAYRKLSVDGCEVVGQGANGKVYRLDPDTIIKVYLNPDSLPDIHRERELARRAFVLGVPTAIPYDVVKVGDGYGSVFELLNARSLAKIIKAEPERVDECIDMSVDLLKKIHGTVVRPEDMPDMRDVAIGWAEFLRPYLPEDKVDKLVALMKDVPVDHHMMHGDYHIKNVMVQNGEALLIDMDTLCQGHPVFELASMFNAYRGFSELDHSVADSFLGIPYETASYFWNRSLQLYLDTNDAEKIARVEKKAMLVGYTRLMRRRIRRKGLESDEGRREIETYKNHIVQLLDEVDSLTF